MSQCRACRTEIDAAATKCPHCQAFQRWYRNPQAWGFLLLLPFLGFFYWQSSLLGSRAQFVNYREHFSIEKVRDVEGDSTQRPRITYRITNRTKLKWEHLSYQLVGNDDKGDLVLTDWRSEPGLVLQPGGEAYVTVQVDPTKEVRSWHLQITDLHSPRY
jgi:hypothetical protein